MKVRFKKLSPDAVIPRYAHDTDAGMDLTATRRELDNDGNVVFAWRKLASAITRKPVAALAVVLAIMTIANLATYASMKAKLTTAEWRYDRLRIHMDSVYEVYNIHNSYSRIVSYENK